MPPLADEPAPTSLRGGRYVLLRPLGEGTQGETYEARDHGATVARPSPTGLAEEFQRYVARARAGETPMAEGLVAIKRFRIGRARAWKDVELAEREARVLATLRHRRLPRYIEHFEEDGALYLVMERIEGETLASMRARGARMTADEIRTMLEHVGEALAYLHALGPPIVHRDVKPGNILRRPDGSYALVDFGSVRDHLRPAGGSTVVGTFGYMAPEQFQGRAAPASDVYGLGATALAMLTGLEPQDLPHDGLAIDVSRAMPRAAPASLVRALRAMLAPDPDRRASSIDEALRLLHAPASRVREGRARGERHEREGARRAERRAARDRERQDRRRVRDAARRRRAPFLPRVVAKVGLSIASLVVWLAVSVLVPAVLVILSLLFGRALLRAARACRAGSRRARAAMGRASRWLSGERADDEAASPRLRVDAAVEPEGVRVAGEHVGLDHDATEDATPSSEPGVAASSRRRGRA